jgi:hypothetical protein
MRPFLEASATRNGGVSPFPFGIGESLLPITLRGMQYLSQRLLTQDWGSSTAERASG